MNLAKRLEILNYGEELLLGLRANGHLLYLGTDCSRRGLLPSRCLVADDTRDEIVATFREAWQRADLVITTGGLGPTADDRTREGIAEVLGVDLQFDPEVEALLRERFARMGRTLSGNNLRQCYLPEGAEWLHNRVGTAHGIYYAQEGKCLVMLPGPPHELEPMWQEQAVPRLLDAGFFTPGDAFLQVRTFGVGESALETRVEPILGQYPGVKAAYCAHQGLVDLRLSAARPDIEWSDINDAAHQVKTELGEDFVAFGDSSLGELVFHQLRALERTLAVAESCSGGLLANEFTDIPGASKVFAGGCVCYNNDVKVELLGIPECMIQQHGAVSAEVALAMATNIAERLNSDYGLSITGFAGPTGGNEENPIGTVYVGYHSPVGGWSRRFVFPGGRKAIKQRAVQAALDWMRRNLYGEKFEEFLDFLCSPQSQVG